MRVLITGAAGFIGRSVWRTLAANGVALTGLGRGAPPPWAAGERWHQADLLDPGLDLQRICAGCDAVVHLAARTHVLRERATDALAAYRAINVEASARLAAAATRAGVRRFVFMSSIKVNGESTGRAANGDRQMFRSSDAPRPATPYGVSKWEAEQRLGAIAERDGLELFCLRPPLVHGAGAGANFARLIRLVRSGVPLPFGAIDNRRSLMYVENLAGAVERALGADSPGPRCVVLADAALSTPELIRAIAAAARVAARLFPCPPTVLRVIAGLLGGRAELARLSESLLVDAEEARRQIGFEPRIGFQDALYASVRGTRPATG